jgi:hypothetical protein
MALAIALSKEQERHVANTLLTGIHDVFPAEEEDENDPVSLKKLKQLEGQFALDKEMLGFNFDGIFKTMILNAKKQELLLTTLHKWIWSASRSHMGIPFQEFESVTSKLRHAFIAIPAGRGLMTPYNKLLQVRLPVVYLHRNKPLLQVIKDCRDLLREATKNPTPCRELVMGETDFVGVKDASIHGVGGIVVGDKKECVPTVFRLEWPDDIKEEILKTNSGNKGNLTNSDLECAGLLLLWLVMEQVCDPKPGAHFALFSDNSPTVSWVNRLAAKGSLVAGELLRALALRMKAKQVSPLTTLHIAGQDNAMTDIPSRSFGSEEKWYCKTDADLLTLFNDAYPLPNQNSWTVFQISFEISMRVISVLRMQAFGMAEWRRLPKLGTHIGQVGRATSNLWEWTLSYRTPRLSKQSGQSQDSPQEFVLEDLVAEESLKRTWF